MLTDNPLFRILASFAAIAPAPEIAKAKGFDPKVASLFVHFVAAESVEFHLRRSLSFTGGPIFVPKTAEDSGEQFSALRMISVYYAMIFVVVEGFQELGLSDERVEAYLKSEERVKSLKRFRNATFHYQSNPLSSKLSEFLDGDPQGEWVRGLAKALQTFFERELDLLAYADFMKTNEDPG